MRKKIKRDCNISIGVKSKIVWKIEEDSITSKRKKKFWISSIGMELVGAQSWGSKTWRSSPILQFPLELFESWATPFESIECTVENFYCNFTINVMEVYYQNAM